MYSNKGYTKILKIIDFGYALTIMPEESIPRRFGNPLYSSPQVFLNHKYSEKCDIWSIGMILYQLFHLYGAFLHNTAYNYEEQIEKTRFNYEFFNYLTISNISKTFLVKMLTYEDELRPSSESLLLDEWIRKESVNLSDDEKLIIIARIINIKVI